ncbi:EGF-like domain-containing protein [Cavenderia fasciculata]|uniref:EGF-like domain-containing protein n=1 Tax=Cavenderia fasciculata TaxID=261658 RepID=F4PH67_CACFS|nr:EGF-like domain-containing protein [Cavenderia fasciculata]EGG25051.1 EGF-like domain-containing protein [Cavenderia fasciculata]|eukprot:XP_004362902.1 EGF-like domain-containing protein [Cavenderia fasciculata]
MFRLFLTIIIGLLTVTTSVYAASPTNSAQYAEISNLVSKLGIGSLFPVANEYCVTGGGVLCDSLNQTIISLSFQGRPAILSATDFDAFLTLTTLKIQTWGSAIPNDLIGDMISQLPNLNVITCIGCQLTALPTISRKIDSLDLTNNQITGDLSTNQLNLIKTKLVVTPGAFNLVEDPTIPLPSFPNILTLKTNNFIEFNYTTDIKQLKISFGPNFDSTTFGLIERIRGLESIVLDNTGNAIFDPVPFPHDCILYSPNIASYTSFNVNYQPLNEIYNFNLTKLQTITIDGSPSLFVENKLPIIVSPNSLFLSLPRNNLTSFNLDDYANFNDISLDLSFNNIVGSLPNIPINMRLDVRNNSFTGTVPDDYCFKRITSFANNQLTGLPPMCYICYSGSNIQNIVGGNQFTTFSFADCDHSSINVTNVKYVVETGPLVIRGANVGFTISGLSTSIPSLSFKPNILNREFSATGSVALYNQFVGNKTIEVSLQVSSQPFDFVNTVEFVEPHSISSYDYDRHGNTGFKFTFNGIRFGTNQSMVVVLMGGYKCNISSIVDTKIECVVGTTSIPEVVHNATIRIDDLVTASILVTFRIEYPFVTSIFPPSLAQRGGSITLYGEYGPVLTNPIVKIGGDTCDISAPLTQSTIVCTLAGGVGVKDVYISINGVEWRIASGFKYSNLTAICPGDNDECSGHGECDAESGICLCHQDYKGPACNISSSTPSGEISFSPMVSTISNDNLVVRLGLVTIKEMNIYGEMVRQFIPNPREWRTISSSDSKSVYSAMFEVANITYTLESFNQSTTLTFADKTIQMDAGTMKMTLNITNWSYYGTLNTLQVVMRSHVNVEGGPSKTNCGTKSSDQISTDDNGVLNFMAIERQGRSFYAKFVDRVISDGRATFSKPYIINQTTDGSSQNSTTDIAIDLPFFRYSAIIDPDFSVLLTSPPDDECNPKEDDRPAWFLPVVVTAPVVGGAAIIGGAYFLIKKKLYIDVSSKDWID